MNWNLFLIKAALVLLNLTRGMAILSFFVLLYFIYVQDGTPTVALPLGNDLDFLVRENPIQIPEELQASFEEIKIQSRGYLLEVGVKGRNVVLYLLSAVLFIGMYLFFATTLYKIVKSSEQRGFFTSKNVLRLRAIGFCLIGFDLFMRLLGYFTQKFFQRWLATETDYLRVSVEFLPDIFNNWIFLGLLVLILAQAFSQGLKIKEEQELTI